MPEKEFVWEWENDAVWDKNKEHIISNHCDAFNISGDIVIGGKLPSVWGHLKNGNDRILGYGWIDLYDDGPEISIVIDDVFQVMGLGNKILEMLVDDVKSRGYTFVGATVKNTNVFARQVVGWLCKNGFSETNFGTSVSVEFALKIFEKGQDLNLIKRLQAGGQA